MGKFSSRLLFSFCATTLAAIGPLQAAPKKLETSSYEEAFLVRRIAEFFKDGDYELVKTQIEEFFKSYPGSPLGDHLHGVLGDLLLEENQYADAIESYNAIKNPDVVSKIILNKLQCYYELEKYAAITDEGMDYLAVDTKTFGNRLNEFKFLMAESLYRQALATDDKEYRSSLSSMASGYYENLLDTSYADVSRFALAEIYNILGADQKAAETYLRLADDHPEMKEELLFRAAGSMASFDREKAISYYTRIVNGNENYAKEAAFNRLILYFQQEDYEKVISSYSKIERIIPEEQIPTFNYMLGKSYFSLDKFEEAIAPIESYLASHEARGIHERNALLIGMTSAYEMRNEALFTKCLERYQNTYPDDRELPKALFMHAMLCKESGDQKEALTQLETLMAQYNNFDQQEGLLFEYAYVAHQNGLYQTCRSASDKYLKDFKGSPREAAAWKLFLASSLEVYKEEEPKSNPNYTKELFFADLSKVLDQEALLSGDERREYELLYAKMAYELSYYPQALKKLTAYISEKGPELAEAHFLMGLCEYQLEKNPSKMVSHFEEVLELSPNYEHKGLVHLHLYNGYLTLQAETKDIERKSHHLDKAADHLYAAMETSFHPIKTENRLWLAEHYYEKAKFYITNEELLSDQEVALYKDLRLRAENLYNDLFFPESSHQLISFSPANLFLEPEALKYAELLGYAGNMDKKIHLLTSLVEQQDATPDWEWKYQRTALFELAKSYEGKHDYIRALETYSFISARERNISSPIVNLATFHSAKLRYMLLEDYQKNEGNPEVQEILTQLKELQIRKNAESEPVHLEAALEYASIRAELSRKNERDERYLFFLNRIYDDYNDENDAILAHYKKGLAGSHEKETLFTAYMKYIEAEKMRLAAKEKRLSNQILEAEEMNEQTLALLFEIESNEYASDYLHARVLKSIEAISVAETY